MIPRFGHEFVDFDGDNVLYSFNTYAYVSDLTKTIHVAVDAEIRAELMRLGWTPPPEFTKENQMTNILGVGDIKSLRESLCAAQAALNTNWTAGRSQHAARIQALIDQLDILRPLGPDGKHGDRHTQFCGCEAGFRVKTVAVDVGYGMSMCPVCEQEVANDSKGLVYQHAPEDGVFMCSGSHKQGVAND